MVAQTVSILVAFLGVYLLLGLLFALPFVARWVGKLDPAAAKGSWGFRLLIVPGVMAFWPVFVRRLLKGVSQPPMEHNAHRDAATRENP